MSQSSKKKIGLLIGNETEWPEAFLKKINETKGVSAELVKLGPTFMDEAVPYDLIVDRISHEIPYYRAYIKYAAVHGAHIINNPFTWSADSRFFGINLLNQLGLPTPRTVLLPNKDVEMDTTPDTFRNLKYPMNWEKIIEYVGVPAIFKDIHSGGRRPVYRVSNVDDLLTRYDESSTRTKILQQVIDSDTHIHGFVIGQEAVLMLRYSLANGRYLPGIVTIDDSFDRDLTQDAIAITKAYGYDINMVEFVVKDGKTYIINGNNPAPDINRSLMSAEQFDWCVDETVKMVIDRAKRPLAQQNIFRQ